MLDKKIGFIGSGNMGRAMIGGIISSGLVPASHLIASAKTQVTLDTLSEQYGIRTTLDCCCRIRYHFSCCKTISL